MEIGATERGSFVSLTAALHLRAPGSETWSSLYHEHEYLRRNKIRSSEVLSLARQISAMLL